ncbi:hypothetical protein ACLOJK_029208, partial [Asimina triloba]
MARRVEPQRGDIVAIGCWRDGAWTLAQTDAVRTDVVWTLLPRGVDCQIWLEGVERADAAGHGRVAWSCLDWTVLLWVLAAGCRPSSGLCHARWTVRDGFCPARSIVAAGWRRWRWVEGWTGGEMEWVAWFVHVKEAVRMGFYPNWFDASHCRSV